MKNMFSHVNNPPKKKIWVCLKIGYIPNEIAIFHRDHDQQNHWDIGIRGTQHFQTHPYIIHNLPGILRQKLPWMFSRNYRGNLGMINEDLIS